MSTPLSRFLLPALAALTWLVSGVAAAQAQGQQLVVQADQWCPYNCKPGAAQPGYAIEILQAVFEPGIKIKYEVVPWDRAMYQTQQGDAGAVVAATQRQVDAYGLLTGQETVGNSNDCLYVAAANQKKISRPQDLDTLNSVAIVSGYTYAGDFNAWLGRPENKGKIVVQRGEAPAEANARNLALGRLDGVIENYQVMSHIIYNQGLGHDLAATICQKQTPIYIAFSPKLANVRQIVKQFDDGVAKLRQSGQLAKILARYGQGDWK